ncbi:hypothetical protein IC582_000644 [Cucumis melo]
MVVQLATRGCDHRRVMWRCGEDRRRKVQQCDGGFFSPFFSGRLSFMRFIHSCTCTNLKKGHFLSKKFWPIKFYHFITTNFSNF